MTNHQRLIEAICKGRPEDATVVLHEAAWPPTSRAKDVAPVDADTVLKRHAQHRPAKQDAPAPTKPVQWNDDLMEHTLPAGVHARLARAVRY